ncbi:hypothetical protein ElyMa_004047500 [Elysia marginata]|uniref:Sushi domain-containing protein n=1 Tax=Elysia marginata TaxID=1093978 RepID=A0AAV4G5J9_9GAST|nr:hypothetical protein ElyMa_004047500 [Elysia marginata]
MFPLALILKWCFTSPVAPDDVNVKLGPLKHLIPCPDKTTTYVDEFTKDITCKKGQIVEQINLSGVGVDFICSLYISGGKCSLITYVTTAAVTVDDDDDDAATKIR